jgi:CBS domain containing-hemolysin-like protein
VSVAPLVWLVVVAAGLLVAFMTAFARAAAYLDRDAYEDLLQRFDEHRRNAVAEFMADPLAVQFAADSFAALLLVVLTGAALSLAGHLADLWSAPRQPLQVGLALAVWAAFILATEIVPRFSRFEGWRNAYLSHPSLVRLSYWLYWPLVALALRFRRRRKGDSESDVDEVVERALETLAETAGLDEPIIDREEANMIRHVLELDETDVREIMVPRIDIVAVPETASFEEIRELVRREGHSRVPVFRDDIDRIIGIIHVKDLFLLPPEQEVRARLDSFLREPYVVPETKNVAELLQELRTAKSHMAIVVDEHGGTAGLVTLEDIVEEVVGEIGPLEDLDEHPIRTMGPQMWRVSGVVSLSDLNDELDLDLPDEDFETVSGLIYDRVGGLPQQGQVFKHGGLRWVVERMDGQRIVSVRLTRLPARSGAAAANGGTDTETPA